jgi:hypothetical protein
VDNFNFRTASPFVDVQARVDAVVTVAAPTSTDTSNAVAQFNLNLMEDSIYIAIANGIVSASGYTPNQAFSLDILLSARESALNSANTDILIHHGSTDAPGVDVVETSVPSGTIVDNLAYTEFTDYLSLPAANNYSIDLFDSTQTTLIGSYSVPLSALSLAGEAITVVASGFADTTQNSNGPAFGLYVATSAGGTLIALPTITNLDERFLDLADQVAVYPNPASHFITIELNNSASLVESIDLVDASARVIKTLDPSVMDRQTVDVSDLEKGVYFVRFNSDQKSTMKRIILQ